MIRMLLDRVVTPNKAFIMREAGEIKGFIDLLFKEHNTEERWTKDEKKELIRHLKHLSLYVPGLIIFALPGGMILLPVFVRLMDRRQDLRTGKS